MSKIRPWHLFLVSAVLWAIIALDAAVNKKYFSAVDYFLAFLINGVTAIKFREWEN